MPTTVKWPIETLSLQIFSKHITFGRKETKKKRKKNTGEYRNGCEMKLLIDEKSTESRPDTIRNLFSIRRSSVEVAITFHSLLLLITAVY